MLPHRQAIRPGNMLSVNQEIPEELVKADEAVLCPLLPGQMSVRFFGVVFLKHSRVMFNVYVLGDTVSAIHSELIRNLDFVFLDS